MIVVKPHTVTDTTLASSNITENDYSEWLVGTTYAVDAYVIIATTTPNIHKIYKSVQNSNTGNDPVTDDGSTWWTDYGATNRHKMFDQVNGSQSSRATPIIVEVTPGETFNAVSVLNASCNSVQVEVTDPTDGLVYDTTANMGDDPGFTDWYGYFFDEVTSKSTAIFLDLPTYPSATVKVTVVAETTSLVGTLIIGSQKTLGEAVHGTSVGITDYSTKGTDVFGNTTITQRSYSKRADYAIVSDTSNIDWISDLLAAYRATPLVWIGHEDLSSTIVYGYYRDFDLVYSDPVKSEFSIMVEGLT